MKNCQNFEKGSKIEQNRAKMKKSKIDNYFLKKMKKWQKLKS